jgi:hypothetical protein
MEKLKLSEIKDIFKFFNKKGFSNKKKADLLKIMKDENLYDIYVQQKERIDKTENNLEELKKQKLMYFNDFQSKNISITEMSDSESTSDNHVHEHIKEYVQEDEFEVFTNQLLAYGDYPEIEDQLNEIETNEEKKEFLLKQKIEDIKSKYYKFGNSMQFSSSRGSSHYIIGKNNEIIYCTDSNFGDGALVIPYSITKYTNNAQECFDFLNDYPNIDIIYLRYDDKFVKQNLDGNILEKWNWKIMYDVREKRINIELPNGNSNDFKLNTKVSEIVGYFQNIEKEQTKIVMNINYLTSDMNDLNYMSIEDFEPLLPSVWTVKKMGHVQNENKCSINYSYTGPLEQKDDFIEYIKNIYDFENNKNQTNKIFEYEVKSF